MVVSITWFQNAKSDVSHAQVYNILSNVTKMIRYACYVLNLSHLYKFEFHNVFFYIHVCFHWRNAIDRWTNIKRVTFDILNSK